MLAILIVGGMILFPFVLWTLFNPDSTSSRAYTRNNAIKKLEEDCPDTQDMPPYIEEMYQSAAMDMARDNVGEHHWYW